MWFLYYLAQYPLALLESSSQSDSDKPNIEDNFCAGYLSNLMLQGSISNGLFLVGSILYPKPSLQDCKQNQRNFNLLANLLLQHQIWHLFGEMQTLDLFYLRVSCAHFDPHDFVGSYVVSAGDKSYRGELRDREHRTGKTDPFIC